MGERDRARRSAQGAAAARRLGQGQVVAHAAASRPAAAGRSLHRRCCRPRRTRGRAQDQRERACDV